MRKCVVLSLLIVLVVFCAFMTRPGDDRPVPVPAGRQRTGDARKGYAYLVTGDYVRSGLPYQLFLFGAGSSQTNYLHRDGYNKNISHEFTAIKAANGEILVAPNCLQCHAQVFNGELIIGLGNSLADFTKNDRLNPASIGMLEKMLQAGSPLQYEAAHPFLMVTRSIAPYLQVPVKGVNIADRLAAVLVSHRDPATFRWNDDAQLVLPQEVIPTDTPPWWLLKKKHAMFYNGFGRGDFGRFLMASNLLTVNDTAESRQVDEHMPDVLAYIYSLHPPKYPGTLNRSLAEQGKTLFEAHCSSCHGTYGAHPSYPNLLIPESMVGTDSLLYQSNYSSPQFVNWFNKSWFTTGDYPAQLQPFNGYMAPPLDGIWITAPYLHNGSVPTLEALLDSRLRPEFWSRDFDHPQYDLEKLGWKYSAEPQPGGNAVYNTQLRGYGRYGHYFGDALTPAGRKAVLEYLKTL